ncbi:MAG: fatty acyl-CoA synthetase [Nocardioides sp.]
MSGPELVAQARQQSLGDLPRRTAQRMPDKLAIVDGDIRMTFADFDARVDAVATALTDAGLAKGDRLALLSHNCWQYALLDFATARAGIVLVPVNFMLGPDEVAFILEHSGATAFVVEEALVDVATRALSSADSEVATRAVVRRADGVLPDGWVDVQDWCDHEGTSPAVPMADDDPVRLMYTSGTESRPKGAVLTSRSLLWQYVSCVIDSDMSPHDVELHAMPMYHCAQLDVFLGPDVYVGATSIILPAPDPAAVLRNIEEHRVTKFFAPPTVWIALLRAPEFEQADLSSLRKGYYGASPMPVEILKEMQQRLPDVELWNLYGQTELAPLATLLPPHEQLEFAGSAGRATLNVETRIVDDEDNEVAVGEIGEIVHRSPHATLGYYRDEPKTADAFRSGWFHSGDLAYADDTGHIYVVDRKKDMIKTGGENVASREVEEAVYQLAGVAEVAVFGIDHPRWVEAVVAVVVPRPDADLTEDQVIEHCRGLLAGYKVPKHVVLAAELPKNPSGKILKRELRQQHAALARA